MYKSRGAWNDFWQRCLKLCQQHKYVLYVDIADFYNQMYHHTVENQLIESRLPNQASKWILKMLENVSGRVVSSADIVSLWDLFRKHGVRPFKQRFKR